MTIRFDLPESLEEFDEQEDGPEQPCFPYPGYDDRHRGIDFWASATERHPVRLQLKGASGNFRQPVSKRLCSKGRKVLLKVIC
ncbi:hypothetical protein GZ77_11245 [Endozoicomonas montiporae]|uniref:Uncharacterized protein n=2 Tax=Endozoicomonas montiporae TaxID=1027273 RepID=A0A081N8R8_9GAMM|nr:hypothetical protein [Endozoicomonas montiporae]AMO55251.1 hypothetical protein EZMO1_1044 [Endozoicomonas montiporae CL-33]KEQ14841.1 hypothetical protein GZ77_11245 [Endozoicomonas montiporae]